METCRERFEDILNKSGRDDFKICLIGYPAFFNEDTIYCKEVTFFYWNPHRRTQPSEDRYPYLSQELRRDLNVLVQQINSFISGVIDDFNTRPQYQGNLQAVYIHTDAVFHGHRFCEEGVNEPDEGHLDTWFFLSGWPDDFLPDPDQAAGEFVASLAANTAVSSKDTTLPDLKSCDARDQDVGVAFQCAYAQAVANDVPDAVRINKQDQAAMASGDLVPSVFPGGCLLGRAKRLTQERLASRRTRMKSTATFECGWRGIVLTA